MGSYGCFFFSFLSLEPWSWAVSLSLSALPIQTNRVHTSAYLISSAFKQAGNGQEAPTRWSCGFSATVTFGKWGLIYHRGSKVVCSARAKVFRVKWGEQRVSRPQAKRWKSLECGGRSLSYPEKILEVGGKFLILMLDRRSKQIYREFHPKLIKGFFFIFWVFHCSFNLFSFLKILQLVSS